MGITKEGKEKMETNAVKKLTAKIILGGTPEQPPAKKTVPLYQIYGEATGSITKEGDYGPWTKLVGQFEAVNLATGEVFAAPQCFLHGPYDEMIAQKMTGENAASSVTFALEVGVRRPTSGTMAYEYVCTPIRDPAAADPLAALRENIPGLKLLADKTAAGK